MFSNTILSASLVKKYFCYLFNIFIVFESEIITKKASLFETKRAQIVILHKKGFLQKKFAKTCPVTKRPFIKQLLDFKILPCRKKEWKVNKNKPL